MADDDVTVVLDSEGTIGTTGSMPLLALELTTIEKAGLISEIDEDSNLQALGNPLLGTICSPDQRSGASTNPQKSVVYTPLWCFVLFRCFWELCPGPPARAYARRGLFHVRQPR